MAVKTCVANGKASSGATWEPATPAETSDELVIPTGKEVKFDATLSVVSLKVEGTGKAAITKGLTLTGTGESLKVVEGSLSVTTAAGKVSFNPGGGTAEIKTAGNDLVRCGLQGTAGSKYKLIDKLRASEEILFKAGVLTTANQEISAGSLSTEGASNKEFILGSSVIKLSAATAWTAQTGEANVVIKAETSTIECTNTSATFNSGNYTYNVLTFTGTKATLNGGGTYAALNFSLTGTESEREVQIAKSSAITVTAITKSSGTVKMGSTEAGKAFTLVKASGTLTLQQVLLKDSTAEGGATFIDVKTGAETTNVSNNAGWTFETVSPAVIPLAAATSISAATESTTAATKVALETAAGASAAQVSLAAPTLITLIAAASTSAGQASLSAPTLIILTAGSSSSAASFSVMAATAVPLVAASSASTASNTITAATKIALEAAMSASAAQEGLSAATLVGLAAAASSSAAQASPNAPTFIVLSVAASTSAASAVLFATTNIPLVASSSSSSASGQLGASVTVLLDPAVSSSTSGAGVSAPTYVVLVSQGHSASSLGVAAPIPMPLSPSDASSAANALLTAPALLGDLDAVGQSVGAAALRTPSLMSLVAEAMSLGALDFFAPEVFSAPLAVTLSNSAVTITKLADRPIVTVTLSDSRLG